MKTFAITYTINGMTYITVMRATTAKAAVAKIERMKRTRILSYTSQVL